MKRARIIESLILTIIISSCGSKSGNSFIADKGVSNDKGIFIEYDIAMIPDSGLIGDRDTGADKGIFNDAGSTFGDCWEESIPISKVTIKQGVYGSIVHGISDFVSDAKVPSPSCEDIRLMVYRKSAQADMSSSHVATVATKAHGFFQIALDLGDYVICDGEECAAFTIDSQNPLVVLHCCRVPGGNWWDSQGKDVPTGTP